MPAEFPIVRSQRFWECRLNELLDLDSYQVERFLEGCEDARDVAEKVIRLIKYPFHLGQPDDAHTYNAFHGKWCKTVSLDYWQSAAETAAIRIGDCEDSSILGAACSLRLGRDAFVVFGYVADARTGEVLGGHAWYCVKDPAAFGDGSWHYVESTLDAPPDEYPRVPDIRKPFEWGGWRLVPEIIWNDEWCAVVPPDPDTSSSIARFMASMRRSKFVRVGYLELRFGEKETRKKYRAIAEMWGLPVKPLRKAGILAKIRWRR